jgi:hypothetical protein
LLWAIGSRLTAYSAENQDSVFWINLIAQHHKNPYKTTPPPHNVILQDSRDSHLSSFFVRHECPPINFELIPDYLDAADRYKLDYRLLPAISVQESSSAKRYPPDSRNLWGWDSAKTGSESLQRGIDFIARQLSNGHYYVGKTLEQKLHSYNPNPNYAPKIIGLMKEIEP